MNCHHHHPLSVRLLIVLPFFLGSFFSGLLFQFWFPIQSPMPALITVAFFPQLAPELHISP